MIKPGHHNAQQQLTADRLRIAHTPGRPCAENDPEEWFAEYHKISKDDLVSRAIRRARAAQLCAGCPVLTLCRDVAIRGGEWWGIWGGMSEHDRRSLIRTHRCNQSQPAAIDEVDAA